MKRAAALVAIVIAVVAVFATGSGAGGDDGSYEVRAVFDNAAFLVEGEDVRIAGANVGSVAAVEVSGLDEPVREDGSPDPGKAVVVLAIDDPGFQDFRADASCLIRPQSLIGEKFVECEPTQPRAAASEAPPPLEQIPDGEPGEGQYLLPLERNGKTVDLDLVNDIMKAPYPERFRLILNDLGAGFAARGEELGEIIERSNPALRETNEVLAVLARQNRTLADLATNSDAVIGELARQRASVAGFINSSEIAARATANQRENLEQSLIKFPTFLRELRSTMGRLDAFSRAATPVLRDFRSAAPSLTRGAVALGPFADAGSGALTSLGAAAESAGPDIVASDSVIRQIRRLGESGAPATKNLAKLLRSLRKTEGFRYLAEALFNAGGAINSFDQYGHWLRAYLPLNNCVEYKSIPEPGCGATFTTTSESSARLGTENARRALARVLGTLTEPAREPEQDSARSDPDVAGELELTPSEPEAPTEEPTPTDPGEAEAEPPPLGEATQTDPRARMRAAEDLLEFLIGDPREGGGR